MQSIDIADLYYNKVVIAPSLHCGLAILYRLHSDKHWRHCKYCDKGIVHWDAHIWTHTNQFITLTRPFLGVVMLC